MKLKYFVFVVMVLGSFGLASMKFKWLNIFNNVALADACVEFSLPRPDFGKALEALRECIEDCESDEAQIAKKLYDLIEPVSKNPESFKNAYRQMPAILLEMIDLYKRRGQIDEMLVAYKQALLYTTGHLDDEDM